MRLGPGKHLKGRTLMGGIVKPEEFDYFHEVTPVLLDTTIHSLSTAHHYTRCFDVLSRVYRNSCKIWLVPLEHCTSFILLQMSYMVCSFLYKFPLT